MIPVRENKLLWLRGLQYARLHSERVRDNTDPPLSYEFAAVRGFVTPDSMSGYGVMPDGELVGVYSLLPKRGDILLRSAVAAGAVHLNCFDGYLAEFYERHGFEEVHREPNWVLGGPAVLYMQRKSEVNKPKESTND